MSVIVLIPGLAADHRMWTHQIDGLDGSRPASVAFAHKRAASITAMAQAVLEEFDGELALCGASMGGMIAMEAVRLAPQRVRALALLGTVADPETPEMHQLRSDAIQLFEQGRAEEIIRANVPLAFHPENASDPVLTGAYLQMVLDAGTGQNGLAQARSFREAVGVSGVALTKLDGTAKGGIVFSVARELGLPIRYVGVGETAEDLREFDARDYVEALFADDGA